MNKNKKMLTFAIVGMASVLTLAACSDEEKDEKKGEIKKEAKDEVKTNNDSVSTNDNKENTDNNTDNYNAGDFMTSEKDFLYIQLATSISDTIVLLPDSKNLETYDYEMLFVDGQNKNAPIFTMIGALNYLDKLDDKNLTQDELKLKELLKSFYVAEIDFIEFSSSKYDYDQSQIILKTDEDIQTYETKRNKVLSLIKDNSELIKTGLHEYNKLGEYDFSKPFGYITFDFVDGYIELENEEYQEVITDFQESIYSISYMPYLLTKDITVKEINDSFKELQDDYKLIQGMKVYKEDARIQGYFDDLGSIINDYQPLDKNTSYEDIENAIQVIMNNYFPVYYKYFVPQLNESDSDKIDNYLELLENGKFDELFTNQR